MSEVETSVVVVGASAAGLATAACLKKAGVPFEILEQTAEVGTAWRNHYERLHLHTSKGLSHLPHLPFPASHPRYPARAQVVEYLEGYARTFELAPRFGRRVLSIERASGGWITRTEDEAFRSRAIVVATGYTRAPHRPTWPGQDTFGNPILHSSEYKSGRDWTGKRVLVVGIGNSGAEIALDLCEQGARPTIAVRGAINVIPRDFLGIPILAWGLLLDLLPVSLADAVAAVVSRLTVGRLDRLGLQKLPYGPVAQIRQRGRIPLIDVGTVRRIRNKEVEVARGLASFEPGKVYFEGGAEKEFDGVVLATGYRPALGAIFEKTKGAVGDDGAPSKSGVETLPGLYFCGFYVAGTGMLREIARESERIARSIAAAAAIKG